MKNTLMIVYSFFLIFSFSSIHAAHGDCSSSGKIKRPTVILNLDVTPINEEFNPEFVGRRISGRVLVGSNPCRARGISVKIQEKEHDGVVHITAMLVIDQDERAHFCTAEYRPIYKKFSIDVEAEKIVIHNVDRMHNNVVIE